MPKIFDNIEHKLSDALRGTLPLSHSADFCVGYFNLRGWREISDQIDAFNGSENTTPDSFSHCRLLIGMQKTPIELLREFANRDPEERMDNAEAVKLKKQLAREFREQLTIGTPSDRDETALRNLSRQLKEKKVIVKLFLAHTLHAKLYLAYSDNQHVPVVGYLGSSNLTLAGLSKQGELNIDVLEQDAANKLKDWFNARWSDRLCVDISEELIEIIDNSWASEKLIPPYYIYLKIAYNLSQEARSGISEFKIPKIFKNELLEFQEKAVLVAAHHLNKRNGVMIGDVVGLGKTIIACTIAKIFEEDYSHETLVLCPKNLVSMWEGYMHKYELRSKVISQSMVQKDLHQLRRYRTVIIDESHNLRNSSGHRYSAIKAYLSENDSKVILLTATPYNKEYLDLSNQLKLFIGEDVNLGISPERCIKEEGGAHRFTANHSDTPIRSIKAFEQSTFVEDWRELMRLYLVRRTRSFIKRNYARTDPDNKRLYLVFPDGTRSYFPDRISKKVEYKFDPADREDQYAKLYSEQTVDKINGLELPRYGLGNYLDQKSDIVPTREEEQTMQNLSRAGKRLMGFCRTNLYKRLESSGYSFLLSLSRHILRNYLFIYAIKKGLDLPIGKDFTNNLDEFLEDADTDNNGDADAITGFITDEKSYLKKAGELYDLYNKNISKFDWIRPSLFIPALLRHLKKDTAEILDILKLASSWDPEKDRQLNALYKLINTTHAKDKVLVFTQFSDTAGYLHRNLKERGVQKIEVVTGDSDNPTALAVRFSPVSNDKKEIKESSRELRVLISTDVLSEGQNLQDGHIIINYDLPWAIIRLIQRAGRVDRIGQKSENILCYSFLPEDGLENILNLRRRLSRRIQENAEVVGSDEVFFDGDPVNIADLYNENSGIFEADEDDSEVDLASYAYQIWKNALDKNPSLNKIITDLADAVCSTKELPPKLERDAVIVYAKTTEENDSLALLDSAGNIVTHSQFTILKHAECGDDEKALPRLETHHELVSKGVENIRKEEKKTAGTLGRKTSIRYRVYTKLDNYFKSNAATFFATESLKKAIDDIYQRQLTEFARETLGRQLKAGISDEELGKLVQALREEDKLVISSEEELYFRDTRLICSLGLRKIQLTE